MSSNPKLRCYSYPEILLALCAWREARGESDEAIKGVCWTVLNRVNNPGWWGDTVVSVVVKKEQYSSMTHAGDGQLIRFPLDDDSKFPTCLELASAVLDGEASDPTDGADSYFDDSITAPHWASPDKFKAKIGRLNFYKVQ